MAIMQSLFFFHLITAIQCQETEDSQVVEFTAILLPLELTIKEVLTDHCWADHNNKFQNCYQVSLFFFCFIIQSLEVNRMLVCVCVLQEITFLWHISTTDSWSYPVIVSSHCRVRAGLVHRGPVVSPDPISASMDVWPNPAPKPFELDHTWAPGTSGGILKFAEAAEDYEAQRLFKANSNFYQKSDVALNGLCLQSTQADMPVLWSCPKACWSLQSGLGGWKTMYLINDLMRAHCSI